MLKFRASLEHFLNPIYQVIVLLLIFSFPCNNGLQTRQSGIGNRKQELFLDCLSGKDVQAQSDDPQGGGGGGVIDPAKIVEINRLVPKNAIYRSVKSSHLEALQKCIELLRERDNWQDIISRASRIREEINIQVWINAVLATTIYSPSMAGLHKPALIELSPDRFLPRSVIYQAINQTRPSTRQASGACTTLDETTGVANGVENSLWYFREDIQLNAQHWYWHVAYPTAASPQRPDRRGELFYFFHESMLARYNAERLSNNLKLTLPLKADTNNEVVQEGYTTYLTDVNSGSNWGSRTANQRISYSENLPYLPNLYTAIDSRTLVRANGQSVDMRNTLGIDILGDVVERSAYSINPRVYGNIHNTGHNLISDLGDGNGVMGDTTTSMRDIVFYRWHTFVNDIFERHKSLLTEYSATGGDYPLVWSGVQVTSIQVNSAAASTNNLRTFWSQRTFDISRGLDLRRPSSAGPVPVCIKHLNHDPFTYTMNIVQQSPSAQKASIRIYLAPRFNSLGVRFSMEEQRKLIFIMDAFTVNLNTGNNIIVRNSSASSLTKPWSKTFDELEREVDNGRPTMPQCGCGWPEHLLLPKGDADGMVFDLFVLVTNGADDSSGNLGDQSGTCSQPYHYCGIRNQNYPDKKPMGFPFDRRSPFLSPGRRVSNLDEFVGLIPNSRTTQVNITHFNQII